MTFLYFELSQLVLIGAQAYFLWRSHCRDQEAQKALEKMFEVLQARDATIRRTEERDQELHEQYMRRMERVDPKTRLIFDSKKGQG